MFLQRSFPSMNCWAIVSLFILSIIFYCGCDTQQHCLDGTVSLCFGAVTIRFMILRPLTTWTLALHSLLHSTSAYNSRHPLHWRHTADCTEFTTDYSEYTQLITLITQLLKPWTSSLSLPSIVWAFSILQILATYQAVPYFVIVSVQSF